MDSQDSSQINDLPPQSVSDAKARLIAEAGKVDFLAPLRKHPWATVGSAAVLGAALGSAANMIHEHKQSAAPQPARHDGDSDASPASASASHSPFDRQNFILLLQPLLIRGAKLAANWWLTRHQARAAAAEAETATDSQTQSSTEHS